MSTNTAEGTPMSATLEPLPETMKRFAAELETLYRHLPRLLDDGGKGRFVVVKGDRTYGVWDTYRDAKQYAYEAFPDRRFLAQRIDPRFLAELARYFGPVSSEAA